MLLDEPFSNIDNFKKQSLRRKLFKHLKEKGISCIVATHDKDDVLGYADSMLVLDNSKIIAIDSPENLYKNPKNALIASFFDEFNSLDSEFFYAHQIKVVPKSDLKATVKKNYFKGKNYLIEADLNGQSIFFEHPNHLVENTEVNIILNNNL